MKAVLLVLTNPSKSTSEDEFNARYDEHLREILAMPEYVGATRYRSFPEFTNLAQRYLAFYELEVRDREHLAAVAAEHRRRVVDGELCRPPDDDSVVRTMYYLERSPRRTTDNVVDAAPAGLFLAFAQPVSPTRDTDLNDWYDNVHLADVLDLPGFTAAQRFISAGIDLTGEPWVTDAPYLAVYEHAHTNAADYGAAFAKFGERIAAGTVKMTDAIAPGSLMAVYGRITDRIIG